MAEKPQLRVRIPQDMMDKLDAIVAHMNNRNMEIDTRSDLVRLVLRNFIREFDVFGPFL